MTASELIKQLQALPADTKVVVRGYEDGYNDILKLRVLKIKPDENAWWYSGKYQDSEDADAMDVVDLYGENQNPKDEL